MYLLSDRHTICEQRQLINNIAHFVLFLLRNIRRSKIHTFAYGITIRECILNPSLYTRKNHESVILPSWALYLDDTAVYFYWVFKRIDNELSIILLWSPIHDSPLLIIGMHCFQILTFSTTKNDGYCRAHWDSWWIMENIIQGIAAAFILKVQQQSSPTDLFFNLGLKAGHKIAVIIFFCGTPNLSQIWTALKNSETFM